MSKKSMKFLEFASKTTVTNYKSSIGKYEEFHGMSIDELVDEALTEQSERVPHHQLSIISRIEDFQKYLIREDYVHGTITSIVGRVKTVYKRNRVEIPYITPINPKQTRRREYIEFDDILTKEELRCALSHMTPIVQARTLVMAQGGLSNAECELLTLSTFIDELYKYHQCDNIVDALNWLKDENHPVIWVTKLIRQKTKKPYYALIGAEAVNKIAEAKLWEFRRYKKFSEKLLNIHKASFGRACRIVNEKCNFGLVAEQSKLRPHNLRRFNATYIKGSALTYEEHSLTNSQIDEMQGRGKTSVQDTYIKTDKLTQKLLYAKVMNNISLYHEYDYVLTKDDVEIFLVDQVEEKKKLEEKVQKLEYQLQEKQRNTEKLDALRKELGNEQFKELVLGILNTD